MRIKKRALYYRNQAIKAAKGNDNDLPPDFPFKIHFLSPSACVLERPCTITFTCNCRRADCEDFPRGCLRVLSIGEKNGETFKVGADVVESEDKARQIAATDNRKKFYWITESSDVKARVYFKSAIAEQPFLVLAGDDEDGYLAAKIDTLANSQANESYRFSRFSVTSK